VRLLLQRRLAPRLAGLQRAMELPLVLQVRSLRVQVLELLPLAVPALPMQQVPRLELPGLPPPAAVDY
jgi:hypothetical protein